MDECLNGGGGRGKRSKARVGWRGGGKNAGGGRLKVGE